MKNGITIQLSEYICGYCQKSYIAKRSDSNYCSHSCRQLAYVQRRTNTQLSTPKALKEVVKNNQQPLASPEIKQPLQGNNISNELTAILHKRNNVNVLESLLYDASPQNPSLWVSIRYKYLTECLLNFSETPSIYLNDIKEVYSAFISIQQSTYFMCLPFRYPYSKEIQGLSNNLKSFCMNMEIDEPFKFELDKSTKLQLMAIGCELEEFIPKNSYSKLSFSA